MDRDWTLRTARPDDAEGIVAVARTTWPPTYAALLTTTTIERFLSIAYETDRVRRRIAAADRLDLAVSAGGSIVGFAEWLVPARSIGLVSPSAGLDAAPSAGRDRGGGVDSCAGGPATSRWPGSSAGRPSPAPPLDAIAGSRAGPRAEEAELAATYILPGWQRRGIGRSFHERAVAAYAGRVRAFVLSVARENLPALAFYRSLGYVDSAAYVEELFGERTAELRMRLMLDAPDQGPG